MLRTSQRRSVTSKTLLCLLVGLSIVTAVPRSTAGEIKGAGAGSCGEWVEDRKGSTWHAQIHWVQGYLSAYNVYAYKGRDTNGVFGSSDYKALAVWLDNYCKANPLDSSAQGMRQLVEELERRQR